MRQLHRRRTKQVGEIDRRSTAPYRLPGKRAVCKYGQGAAGSQQNDAALRGGDTQMAGPQEDHQPVGFDSEIKHRAAHADRRDRGFDAIILWSLRTGDKAEYALPGAHHHTAGAAGGIVNKPVEGDFRARPNAEIGFVQKDQTGERVVAGADNFVLINVTAGRDSVRRSADDTGDLVADARCAANPLLRQQGTSPPNDQNRNEN